MLRRINSSLFDWLAWRNGTIVELLNVQQRTCSIISNRIALRNHAIGWAPGEIIPCRPKLDHVAVMFSVDDREFWTHFTKEEFNAVFKKGTLNDYSELVRYRSI